MARVAWTLVADDGWSRQASLGMVGLERCPVLSGGVGPVTGFGGVVRGVGICKPACYICRVERDPQLDINRFESSLLLGYGDLID